MTGTSREERRAPARRTLMLAVAMAGLAPAWAQVQPDAAALEGLRREEERSRLQREQLRPGADVLRAPKAPAIEPAPAAPESPCFNIQQIRLEGQGAESFAWLPAAASPYLGQCVGVRGLGQVAAALDARLLARGHATTRVSLPAQNLQDGVLRVQLHVGRVAGLRMVEAGAAPGAPEREDARWGTWRNAFPMSAGDILDIRDLEQGVEQMRRVPSQQVRTRLEPGAEPDTTVVVIERQVGGWRERVRGGATVDNAGGAALGRAQFSGHLALDNPLGLNDVLSASLSSNLQRPDAEHRSQSLGLNYSVPWGYSTLSLEASHSRFAQFVQGTTVRFLSSGDSTSAEARLARTLWRGSSGKLSAHAAVSMRRAESFIDDVELLVQRRRTTNAEVGLAWRQLFDGASLDLELGVRRGLSWRAQEDLLTAGQGGPTLRPTLLRYSATYATVLEPMPGRPLQYALSLRGQATRDTTLAIDQFAIGGRHSVRGFNGDTVLIAESGFTLRNDFSLPVQLWPGVQTALTLGVDIGRVWGPSDVLLAGRHLAGASAGLRGSTGAVAFDIGVGVPLHRPDGFQSRRWTLYASFTYPF